MSIEEENTEANTPFKPALDVEALTKPSEALNEASAEHGELIQHKPFALELIKPGHPHWDAAEAAEAKIFSEAFGNQPEELDAAYQNYPSEIIAVLDERETDQSVDSKNIKVAGVLRFARRSQEALDAGLDTGFKSLNDIASPEHPWQISDLQQIIEETQQPLDSDTTIDILTIGVDHPTSSKTVIALLHGLLRYSQENDVKNWVAIIDSKAFELIQRFGAPLSSYKDSDGTEIPAGEYMGSEVSRPVYSDIEGWAKAIKQNNPELYSVFADGAGLEELISLPSKYETTSEEAQ